jgi:DNA-binding NarL/FixJ family response regulator
MNLHRVVGLKKMPGRCTNLVIADDDPGFRYVLERCLTPPQHRVVASVEDGLAAVLAVEQHHPEIVLLDISMPRMNGLDAAARIGTSVPMVKIIIISSYAEAVYVDAAFDRGAVGYVLKGRIDDLHDAIRVVMSGERYRPAFASRTERRPL